MEALEQKLSELALKVAEQKKEFEAKLDELKAELKADRDAMIAKLAEEKAARDAMIAKFAEENAARDAKITALQEMVREHWAVLGRFIDPRLTVWNERRR